MSGVSKGGVNPFMLQAIDRIRKIHDKKNVDYSAGGYYENFEIVSFATGIPTEQVFLMHIANKTARLKSLNKRGTANFESKADNWLDLATYGVMGYSYQLYLEDEEGLSERTT